MKPFTHTLSNGIRILHIPDTTPVSYIGVAIDAGTRDEMENESGIAHFVEHLLFKGTEKRRSRHIINRLESIGGQIDAYTTKEETYIYAVVPQEYTERAIELLADVVLHSVFPEGEMEKEREVVLDEISSYNDSPAELIYDEFEEIVFPGDSIGRNILGSEESLEKITRNDILRFIHRTHTPDKMVVFGMGNIKSELFAKKAEKYFVTESVNNTTERTKPSEYKATSKTINRDTCQAHCIIGNRCMEMESDKRLTMLLLNNILGGPALTSRLNIAVREKNGLCYTIESNMTNYTDTGVWNIYFGCAPKNLDKTLRLCMQQLELLREKPLTSHQLEMAKKQLRGQVLISRQNRENTILGLSKIHLHHLPLRSEDEALAEIDTLTAVDLQQMAQQMFNPDNISTLIYNE